MEKCTSTLISKWRTEMYGIAAAFVLLVHSNSVVIWPRYIQRFFSLGGIGVYIFVFYSAVGLYYSLKNQNYCGGGYTAKAFYKRRFSRIFFPYVLIASVGCYFKYVLRNLNAYGFFMEFSTIGWWIGEGSAWYVATIIPIYMLYPFWFRWTETGRYGKIKIAVVLCISIAVPFFVSYLFPTYYARISQSFISLIVFLIGSLFAENIYKGYKNLSGLLILSTFLVGLKLVPYFGDNNVISKVSYGCVGIISVLIIPHILNYLNASWIHKMLDFLGHHSLEVYLTNCYLIQIMKILGFSEFCKTIDSTGLLEYCLIIVCGIIWSVVVNKLNNKICKYLHL